jgi:hypothetical protein
MVVFGSEHLKAEYPDLELAPKVEGEINICDFALDAIHVAANYVAYCPTSLNPFH